MDLQDSSFVPAVGECRRLCRSLGRLSVALVGSFRNAFCFPGDDVAVFVGGFPGSEACSELGSTVPLWSLGLARKSG